jgi:hypothetical protein
VKPVMSILAGVAWTSLFVDPTYDQLYHPGWEIAAILIGGVLILAGILGLISRAFRVCDFK